MSKLIELIIQPSLKFNYERLDKDIKDLQAKIKKDLKSITEPIVIPVKIDTAQLSTITETAQKAINSVKEASKKEIKVPELDVSKNLSKSEDMLELLKKNAIETAKAINEAKKSLTKLLDSQNPDLSLEKRATIIEDSPIYKTIKSLGSLDSMLSKIESKNTVTALKRYNNSLHKQLDELVGYGKEYDTQLFNPAKLDKSEKALSSYQTKLKDVSVDEANANNLANNFEKQILSMAEKVSTVMDMIKSAIESSSGTITENVSKSVRSLSSEVDNVAKSQKKTTTLFGLSTTPTSSDKKLKKYPRSESKLLSEEERQKKAFIENHDKITKDVIKNNEEIEKSEKQVAEVTKDAEEKTTQVKEREHSKKKELAEKEVADTKKLAQTKADAETAEEARVEKSIKTQQKKIDKSKEAQAEEKEIASKEKEIAKEKEETTRAIIAQEDKSSRAYIDAEQRKREQERMTMDQRNINLEKLRQAELDIANLQSRVGAAGGNDNLSAELEQQSASLQSLKKNTEALKPTNTEFENELSLISARLSTLKKEVVELEAAERERKKEEKNNSPIAKDTAEYSKALKQCVDLRNKLNKAEQASNLPNGVEQRDALDEYIKKVDELQKKLENGTISQKDFNDSFKALSADVGIAISELNNANGTVQNLSSNLKSFGNIFTNTLKKFGVIVSVTRYVRQLVQTSIDLNSAMTQLGVVTRTSVSDLSKFSTELARSAKEIGSSVTDLADSTTTFARLGYSLDESHILAKYTSMLSNVGDIDVSDAQNAITAIVKAFPNDVSISNIEKAMDKLVTVGNGFPISVSQIAEGINNASSSLAAAGNTFEEAIALITAANTTVQNASKASTGIRTLTARLRNTKAELDELGEEALTTVKYEALVKALTDANVALTNADGSFRSTYDIMKDIAHEWENLNDQQRAALATNIAATRQQDIFFSIINNFKDNAEGAMEAMSNSAGALSEAYDKVLSSTQAHINQLKAAWQELAMSVVDNGLINEVTDFGRALLEIATSISKITKNIGGLKTVLMGLSSLWILKNRNEIDKSLNSISATITAMSSNFGRAFSDAGGGLAGTVAGLKGIGAVAGGAAAKISLLTAAVTLLVSAINTIGKKRVERHDNAIEAADDAINETEALSNLSEKYIELNSEYDGSETSRKNLLSIQDELIDKYGDEVTEVRNLSGAYQDLSEDILNATEEKLKYNRIDVLSGLSAARSTRNSYGSGLKELYYDKDGNFKWRDFLNTSLNPIFSDYAGVDDFWTFYAKEAPRLLYDKSGNQLETPLLNAILKSGLISTNGAGGKFGKFTINKNNRELNSLEDWKAFRDEIGDLLLELSGYKEYEFESTDFYQKLKERYDEINGFIKEEEEQVAKVAKQAAAEIYNSVVSQDGLPKTAEEFEAFKEKMLGMANDLDQESFGNIGIKPIIDAINALVGQSPVLSKFFKETTDETYDYSDAVDEATESVEEEVKTFQDYVSQISSLRSTLETAKSEMESGGLSASTIKSIADETENYLDYLYEENGVVKLNTEAWEKYIETQKNVRLEEIQNEIDELRKKSISILPDLFTSGGSAAYTELSQKIKDLEAELRLEEAALSSVETGFENLDAILTNFEYDISETSSFIDDVTSALQTLADAQSLIADGFVISMEKALEFAKTYPEILESAQLTADGQIQLNEEVAQNFVKSKEAETRASIQSKINDLQAEREKIVAQKELAEAQLKIAQNIGEKEGQISKEEAEYKISLSNTVAQILTNNNGETAEAYKYAAMSMSDNASEVARVNTEVSKVVGDNFVEAFATAADSSYVNANAINTNIATSTEQAHQFGIALGAAIKGEVAGSAQAIVPGAGGNRSKTEIQQINHNYHYVEDFPATSNAPVKGYRQDTGVSLNLTGGTYNGSTYSYNTEAVNLKDFITGLNNSIEGYNDALDKIDGQIAMLENIRISDLESFKSKESGSGSSKSGSGNGSSEASDNYFKMMYAYHQHLLAMDQEEVGDYLTWLDTAYKRAYQNGEITLDEYYKYEEEVYKGIQDLINNSKNSLNSLVQYRIKMLQSEKEKEKESLNDRLSQLKDFYDKQKKMLQDQKDEEDYLKEQKEKRQAVNDIQNQINQLQFDDSAWAQKKRNELQQQLADAQSELDEFESDRALELALDALDSTYESQAKAIQAEIDAIDDILNDPNALYNQALADIKNNSVDLYKEMVAFAEANGENIEDIKNMWETAYRDSLNLTTAVNASITGVKDALNDLPKNVKDLLQTSVVNATGYQTNTPTAQTKGSGGSGSTNVVPKSTDAASGSGGNGGAKGGSSGKALTSAKVGDSVRTSGMAYSTIKGTGNAVDVNGKNMFITSVWNNAANPYWQGEYVYGVAYTPNGPQIGWVKLSQLSGYAWGTKNAANGMRLIDELGPESLFVSSDGNHYRMLSAGDKVLNAKATQFLYDFAMNGGDVINKLVERLMDVSLGKIQTGATINNITMSPITINGNADSATVSEMRRAQREAITETLKAFGRLQK